MKKLVLSAAMLLCLGLGVFAACTPVDDVEPEPPGPDNPPEQTFDFGGYGETKWVSVHGTLDLEEGTYSGASSFQVTGVTGEYEETVISCTMDGAEYMLRYNDYEGRLDLYNAQNEFEYFFLADASAFAGSWYTEDDTSAYYVISSVPDEEGYFTWRIYSTGSVIPAQTAQAITVFMFNEDADRTAGMFLYVPSADISYSYSSGSAVYMSTPESETGSAMTTYTGSYSTAYRNSSGEVLSVDFTNSMVTYQGTTVACSAGIGLYGSGIWFNLNTIDYALVFMGDVTYLIGGGQQVVFAPYSESWLTGSEEGENTWSDSNDLDHFEVLSETSVNFNGTEYSLSVAMENGDTVYRFAVGSEPYVIRPLDGTTDVFMLDTDNSLYRGYYFRDTVMDSFMQTYSSNAQLLTISDEGGISVSVYDFATDETTNYSANFTYLEDIGAIAVAYTPYGALGATFNIANVNSAGIYWAIAGGSGSYVAAATYLTEDFLPTAWDTLLQTLEGDEDFFTTGGTQPVTLSFDRERGTVSLNGEEYYFSWGYGTVRETGSAVELHIVISDEPNDPTLTQYEYSRYTVIPGEFGLDVQFAQIRVDGTNAEFIGTPYWRFCAPDSTMQSLQGITFVYDGRYAQETVTFGEDGAIRVSAIADGAAGSLLKPFEIGTYDLTITRSSDNLETITVNYITEENENATMIIVDRTYLTIGTKVYAHSDLAAVAGTYYADNGDSLMLTERGALSVNGSSVVVLRIDNDVPGQLTVTYRRGGVERTAVFTADGAVADDVSYTKTEYTLESFVGTYRVGEHVVVISAAADNVNSTLSLSVRLNNLLATPSFSYSNGNQTLSFSAFDTASMRRINCTMTLEGDSVSVSINSEEPVVYAVNDWSYGDFVFSGEKTVTGSDGTSHTLTCAVKEEAPVFFLNGEVCGNYVVTIAEDGTATLSLTCNGVTVTVPQA